MKSPLLALQKAIYDRLRTGLSCPVYDDIPEQESFPYVTTGELRSSDWSAKAEPGQEVAAQIHAWSRYPGKKEILEIIDQIVQAISGQDFQIDDGFNVVIGKFDTVEPFFDIDGKTRHAVVNWKFKIEEILP